MKYCNECMHYFTCKKNNWCITMDAERKYNGEYVCDNFATEHWGIYNNFRKEFQFNIDESSKNKAKQKLFNKIGYDSYKWRFDIRKLPKEMYIRKIYRKDGTYC